MSGWSQAGLVLAGGLPPVLVAVLGGRHLVGVERFRVEHDDRRLREERRLEAYADFIAAVGRVINTAVRVHTGELPADQESSTILYKAVEDSQAAGARSRLVGTPAAHAAIDELVAVIRSTSELMVGRRRRIDEEALGVLQERFTASRDALVAEFERSLAVGD